MKKIVFSLVMTCALFASSAVMAQDKKCTKSTKTETTSCCAKKADKKACTEKSDSKKATPSKEAKK